MNKFVVEIPRLGSEALLTIEAEDAAEAAELAARKVDAESPDLTVTTEEVWVTRAFTMERVRFDVVREPAVVRYRAVHIVAKGVSRE